MTPNHHLSEATVVSFAAGALSPEMSAVAATHLQGCRVCRRALADAETVGGALLARQQSAVEAPADLPALRQDMLARLDAAPLTKPSAFEARADTGAAEDGDLLPLPLRAYFGPSWSALRWRWAAPGLHMIRATGTRQDQLVLLKVAPGRAMPLHSHQGGELTQILKGAYDDVLGHFGPGDAADLDHETLHQPTSAPGVPCICVAALDAPLAFPGWLARRLQAFVGL